MKQKVESNKKTSSERMRAPIPILQVRIQEPLSDVKPIELSELKNEEKIPKENIKVIYGVDSVGACTPKLICTVRKGSPFGGTDCLRVVGEYRGSCHVYVMLFIMYLIK